MMELNELEQGINRLEMLITEPEYFEQWFDAELVEEAQLRVARKIVPQLIRDWKRMRTEERERAASK
jgi:hypothetical protein